MHFRYFLGSKWILNADESGDLRNYKVVALFVCIMSFAECTATVRSGDVVIVFLGHDSMFPVTVKPGDITQTKFGAMKHDDLIGHQYGNKFSCSKGWVHVLQPTPELWTLSLPHRTQILYSTDIAMVILQLELKPGSIVCESGTGSGSLSHALIRTVAPTGHLHTVEFNLDRYKKAESEFEEHGLSKYVSVYHRDVLNDGFPIEDAADAVFLDIPQPDQAVLKAAKALKKNGGRLCSFSPCLEQTQRTCDALHKSGSGFYDIETVELVQRSYNVKRIFVPIADIGLGNLEVKDRLLSPEEDSPVLPCAYETGDQLPLGDIVVRTTPDPGTKETSHKASKRRKTDSVDPDTQTPDRVLLAKGKTAPAATKHAFACRTCVLPKEIYGHTGYLTVATYCPSVCIPPL